MSVRDQWYVNGNCIPIDSEESYPRVRVTEHGDVKDVFYLNIDGNGMKVCLALSRAELVRLHVNVRDCLRTGKRGRPPKNRAEKTPVLKSLTNEQLVQVLDTVD